MASLGTGRQTIVDGRFAEVQVGSGGGSDGAKPLGQHPLHLAADWTDDVAIIQALLDAGANGEGGERRRQPARGSRVGHSRQRGVLAPRGAGGRTGTRTNLQRQPQLVRRGLGRRFALRRVDRDRASGAACSYRYGLGRCGRLPEGATKRRHEDRDRTRAWSSRRPTPETTSSSPRVTSRERRGWYRVRGEVTRKCRLSLPPRVDQNYGVGVQW